jgi:hypothetical protein
MQPSQPTTPAERTVIRWFFSLFGIIALGYLAFVWWSRAEACSDECALRGALSGELRFTGGGRLNIGTRCECVP